MAYIFGGIDLTTTYGLVPGHQGEGNTALEGCFDFPSRIGDTFHEWGDENGSELYSASGQLFFGGRDLAFTGHIIGTRPVIYDNFQALYAALTTPSGLSVFATPYGTFNVYPKVADPQHYRGISTLKMTFREPVVTLTGGTIPATTADPYMIDGIPMKSFGLYAVEYKGVISLADMKEQLITKYGSEGYGITKRISNEVPFTGLLLAANLTTFKANVLNLFALFSSIGERAFTLNSEVVITGLALNGFKVDKILVTDGGIVARFNCTIIATSIV